MSQLIHTSLDGDGILVATIDMPGRTMNVFSAELMDALEALMDRVDGDPAVQSVVLTSGKSSFLAGADLVMVRSYCDAANTASHDDMFTLCGRLGRQFVRLESSLKPWIAAVNGIALGGGLELALACRVRLVSNDPRIQLGLPEVRLGLLPGAGGTQRLPRLLGFEAAMDLLLTGRSLAPTEAVQLGLFAQAVPGAQLLDAAKAVARAQHGRAFDVNAKFPHLAQEDVPAHEEAVARAIAARHGIDVEDFERYPAYSAIIDSVLKGAHLSLTLATALEMNQFLRLMFNPVAGHMVRTLFLERLRAERELAAPPDTRVEHLAVGTISTRRCAWSQAFAKLKIPQSVDATLPADTMELVDQTGAHHRVSLRVIDDDGDQSANELPVAVLAPAGPYGRVLEIIANHEPVAAALAALATQMWCVPWRTPGPGSVLLRLRGAPIAVQAQTALCCAAQAGAGDVAFFDVAACLAGVTPAWTGGPLTWLWAEQQTQLPRLDAVASAAWTRLKPALRQACA
jgi:3-hydroxyacyl-CoA dehydrogenase / enoyl-CoA hydratase / 3-hydroxybutyryl-CoA epimerase